MILNKNYFEYEVNKNLKRSVEKTYFGTHFRK